MTTLYEYQGDPNYKITRQNMSRAEKKALKFVEENGKATVSDIAGHLQCKTYWAIQHLTFLTKNGFIKNTAPNEYSRIDVE